MSDFRSNCFCHWVWLPSPLQMISLSQTCFFLPWGAWRHKWMPVHYCFQVIESSRRYYWRGQINSRTLVEAAHQKVFWKKGKWSSGKFKSFLCDPLLWEDFFLTPLLCLYFNHHYTLTFTFLKDLLWGAIYIKRTKNEQRSVNIEMFKIILINCFNSVPVDFQPIVTKSVS